MTSNHFRETAKIYQFPAGGRAALSGGYEFANFELDVVALRTSQVSLAQVADGACWYHDEAIRDAAEFKPKQ